jgi:FkbM family methyltransferase
MQRLRDILTSIDRVRYLAWRARRSQQPATFRLHSGERLFLRAPPATDTLTAYEIFVAEVYRSVGPNPDASVRRIVDVGANVGFSLLYFASRYPNAQMVAFEPHPVHVSSLRKNLELNNLTSRVTLHPVAACSQPGTVRLSDDENCSSVVAGDSSGAIEVAAADFFEEVGTEPIEMLKMDIEGGEYDLLHDARFAGLDVRTIVLEWHRSNAYPDGRDFIR